MFLSVASVAKAILKSTTSINNNLLLSNNQPPFLYVVSKPVLQNHRAEVEVQNGLPKQSITTRKGINFNVSNINPYSYRNSINSYFFLNPYYKFNSRNSHFFLTLKYICCNNSDHLKWFKIKDKVRKGPRMIINELKEILSLRLLVLSGDIELNPGPVDITTIVIEMKKILSRRLLGLSGDIESNPGPIDITMITLNSHGLKNNNKFTQ